MLKSALSICVICSICVASSSAKCGPIFENKVTEADKKEILNVHNNFRWLLTQGKVPGQPKAKHIGPLKWDSALAAAAQKIAETCEFKHVKVNDRRFYVGQNLALTSMSYKQASADWKGAIQRWFDEHKDFTYPDKQRGMTGHYTQVIWEGTKYIGCGYTWYKGPKYYEKLYVCNYGPGGNIIGQAPYTI